MADINVNNNYTDMKNLTPFKLCVLQNFPFIEADFDAVTNYQLLCKVVEYLNKVIDNNNNQNNNISQLEQNFITLYNYVKDYFDNLDVQEEINNKLDNMASDGSLSRLIQPLFDEYKTTIDSEVNTQNDKINAQNDKINAQNDKINAQNDKIVVLKNRMDTFASLPSGSTTGDAELIDIRVPASGFNNNKTYSTAGDAVRGQVSVLKEDLVNICNTFKVEQNNGWYNPATGDFDTSSQFYGSKIASVVNNRRYRINMTPVAIIYFNNGTYISGKYSTDNIIDIPDGINGFSVTCESRYSGDLTIEDVTNTLQLESDIENSSITKFSVNQGIGWYNPDNGIFDTSSQFYGSKKIALLGGRKYKLLNGSPLAYTCFDSNMQYTEGAYSDSNVFTMPINSVYISFTMHNTFKGELFITDVTDKTPLVGKTAFFNGDSICYGSGYLGGYPKLVSEEVGMNYTNYGVPGTTLAKQTTRTDSILERLVEMGDNCDYLILEGGVNDCSENIPLGTLSNGYDAELDEYTLYGAVESIIKQCLNRYVGTHIGFILVHRQHNYGTIASLETYFDAIKEACNKWSIPCLDLFHTSGLNTELESYRSQYTLNSDGVHPNELGYNTFYKNRIIDFMEKM